jgi:hypothetical protein
MTSTETGQGAIFSWSKILETPILLYLFSETSRHFRYKKREYLKDRIDELAMNSKNKNIRDLYRGINDFKRG